MFNKVILVGRLGDEPVKKEFGSTLLCELRVATEKGRGDKKETQWHTVKAFGELGRTCLEHLKKGRTIVVVGELSSRKVNDRVYFDVVASEVTFL